MGVGAGCQCNIASGQTCNLGGGCPRYGDYNGNACMLGNLYSSWGSATSYPGITPASTSVNAFFAMKVVVNEPPVAVCQDFSDVADANCCIMVDVADIDDGSFDPKALEPSPEKVNRYLRKLRWPRTTVTQLAGVLMQRDCVRA